MKSLVLAVLVAVAASASAEITNPIRYTWIADACESWNCAAAALVLANGESGIIVLPTGVEDHPWVVLRRVEEGSIYVPDDAPFHCEVFDTLPTASARFTAMDGCHAPLILNVPDGRTVIASLQKCSSSKRRAAR